MKPLTIIGDTAERFAAGRALRENTPLESHTRFRPTATRPDPVAILQADDKGRVEKLLPIKYGRMSVSPFAFLRGSAGVMAADLAKTPATRLYTQVCGDAHISNFGVFASPERTLVFDINDFDESLPAPWEWDLKRLAASAVVAGRGNGFTDAFCKQVVQEAVVEYAGGVRLYSDTDTLEAWYFQVKADRVQELLDEAGGGASKAFQKTVKKARTKTQQQTFEGLTEVVNGSRRFKLDPPRVTRLRDVFPNSPRGSERVSTEKAWNSYVASVSDEKRHLLRRYHLVDAAFRVGGVGSVGTMCMIALLQGGREGDALILQQKAAGPSVLEPYAGKSVYATSAERVVHGQRLMQAASDIFLGWHHGIVSKNVFYWRQLKDMKGDVDPTMLNKAGFKDYVRLCAFSLARAHGRAGNASSIAGYAGKGRRLGAAIADFSVLYADQTERDHQALLDAIKSRRVKSQPGV